MIFGGEALLRDFNVDIEHMLRLSQPARLMAPARAQAVAAVAGACAGVLVTLAVMQRRKKACKPKKKKPAKVATLRHIVLVKLKPDTPDEAIEAMLAGLAELPKKIPTILRMEIGRQHAAVDDGRNVALGGVVEFAADADYEAYAKDDAHLAVIKELILPYIAEGGRTALQYDISGTPASKVRAGVPRAAATFERRLDDARAVFRR